MRIILLLALASQAASGTGNAVEVWKLSARRSTFAEDRRPQSLTLRIERYASGEVFTVDTTEKDGRSTTDSTTLFLDGKPREYRDLNCNGTQTSLRVDNRTVEITRTCETGTWMRFIRRVNAYGEMVVDVSGRRPDGHQVQMRLVLEKQ